MTWKLCTMPTLSGSMKSNSVSSSQLYDSMPLDASCRTAWTVTSVPIMSNGACISFKRLSQVPVPQP